MRKLSVRERVLLVCLAVLAAGSAYVLLFHMPMSQREEQLQASIDESAELMALLEQRLASQRQMQAELDALAGQPDAPALMPEYDNTQAVMVQLNEILTGCEEYSISFSTAPEEGQERVICRQVVIPFRCADYEGARQVLQQLHDSPLRCQLEDVELTWQDQGGVSAQVTMVFYEYQVS